MKSNDQFLGVQMLEDRQESKKEEMFMRTTSKSIQ